MISDVLAEALDKIQQYREDYADRYGHLAEELDQLEEDMERLRELLDAPPAREGGG